MTNKINLKEIEKITVKFNSDVEMISKELKRVQSIKCRLKKMKGKSTYQIDMQNTLDYEQVLKEAKMLLEPREKFVTEFQKEDIDKLDYTQTMKAIKSIQSKKTLSKWLTTIENDNDEYRRAVAIEKMLLEHKEEIQPLDDEYIRKTDVQKIIDTIEESGKLSQQKVVELLRSLL